MSATSRASSWCFRAMLVVVGAERTEVGGNHTVCNVVSI